MYKRQEVHHGYAVAIGMVLMAQGAVKHGELDEEALEKLKDVYKRQRMTSDKYRAIGLGTSGYHHYLVNHDIQWESDEHIEVADKLFENIAYYAIKASMELAKEKGAYPAFKGSEWETGAYSVSYTHLQ